MCQHPWGAFIQPAPPAGHWAWQRLSPRAFPPCLPQTIRQLGNDIEKMLLKVHSGEIVTKLYLQLQEVLKKVSSSSLPTCFPCKGTECPRGCVPGLVPSVPCHSMDVPGG